MGKKLYVGNLPFSATEGTVTDLFAQLGAVDSVRLITDRETGRSKGFAFVEMSDDEAADEAVRSLDGKDFEGRPLRVNEAREREFRPSGGGGGGGGWGDRPSFGGGGGGGGFRGGRSNSRPGGRGGRGR